MCGNHQWQMIFGPTRARRTLIWVKYNLTNVVCKLFVTGVSAHFYDIVEKKMKNRFLSLHRMYGSHTAVAIREAMDEILESYGLCVDQVFRFVTDNGANMVAGLQGDDLTFTNNFEVDDEEKGRTMGWT